MLANVEIADLPTLVQLDISLQATIKGENEADEQIPTKLTIGKKVGNLRKLFYTEGASFAKQVPKIDEQGHHSGYEIKEIDKKTSEKSFLN
ncbi:MAG: hypothetical protein GBAus27B_000158 [Mycoplasmataceae bacterium]|nr:MAG: hypothetical protein GBAus27B_000158 [Mycoplasmataceae bacterium]